MKVRVCAGRKVIQDGTVYCEGAVLEMGSPDQLMELGVVEKAPAKKKKAPAKKKAEA